jgi:Domain of unknown function (DUF1814).
MLRTQTVQEGTLDLIKTLMSDEKLNEFNLVGGTALALQIGHRVSIDIDLFSTNSFNARELAAHLEKNHSATHLRSPTNGVFCFINDIKVDLISHQYPLVGGVDKIEGIRMASLKDIGAMKLNAIYNNGTRLKDFVDMYFLLERCSLSELLHTCHQKYPDLDMRMVQNSLGYHHDIDFSVSIHYTNNEIKWPAISERIKKAIENPHLSFSIPQITRKLLAKNREQQKPKRKGPRL